MELSYFRFPFIVSAKRLMEEARDSEAEVMAALKKAKMAFDNAKIAKTTGENVVKNITVLIKVKKIDVSVICLVTQKSSQTSLRLASKRGLTIL